MSRYSNHLLTNSLAVKLVGRVGLKSFYKLENASEERLADTWEAYLAALYLEKGRQELLNFLAPIMKAEHQRLINLQQCKRITAASNKLIYDHTLKATDPHFHAPPILLGAPSKLSLLEKARKALSERISQCKSLKLTIANLPANAVIAERLTGYKGSLPVPYLLCSLDRPLMLPRLHVYRCHKRRKDFAFTDYPSLVSSLFSRQDRPQSYSKSIVCRTTPLSLARCCQNRLSQDSRKAECSLLLVLFSNYGTGVPTAPRCSLNCGQDGWQAQEQGRKDLDENGAKGCRFGLLSDLRVGPFIPVYDKLQ